MNNWKGCGRKRSWPNLRYYHGICLEGVRKNTKTFSQDSRSPGRDLSQIHPIYEAGVLTTGPRYSVYSKLPFTRAGRLFHPEPEDAPCRGDKEHTYHGIVSTDLIKCVNNSCFMYSPDSY
jgi:hypothetical protein